MFEETLPQRYCLLRHRNPLGLATTTFFGCRGRASFLHFLVWFWQGAPQPTLSRRPGFETSSCSYCIMYSFGWSIWFREIGDQQLTYLLAQKRHKALYGMGTSCPTYTHILQQGGHCSQLFNFLIKFGLSRETPVTTSLGTQIGRERAKGG